MLPIDDIRADVDRALQQTKPLIISAPTGSGKSTQLPLWLDEMTDRLVVVVEPRRVACRALATYLSEQRGEPVGQSIGYAVRFEERSSQDTRILFVTPGVALRLLQPGQRFHALTQACVLLDEFHERGWETDLLAAILLERFEQSPFPFVITSATLDLQQLQETLDATFLEAAGRSYPVDIEHLALDAFHPTRENLSERVISAIKYILAEPNDDGDVLVFLPGKGEIRKTQDQLQRIAKTHNMDVHAIHSGVPLQQLTRLLGARGDQRRRVFLATNIAETSLTVPGITWVVDSGLVRMRVHKGGHTALSLVAASQASMAQRAGRAGRVAPGRCIRLWDTHYAAQPSTQPEVERIELEEVVLRATSCGWLASDMKSARWIASPPEFAVSQAIDHLTAIGALDARGALTPMGQKLSRLPVTVFEARMLVDTPAKLHHTMADLVAILQRGQRLLLSLDVRDEQRRQAIIEARQVLFEGCQDEVSVALRILREGDARRHHINPLGLLETRQIATSLRHLLNDKLPAPHRDPDREDDRQALIDHILKRTPESAFVLRKRAIKDKSSKRSTGQPWTNGQIEVQMDPFEPFSPTDKPQHPPKAGIVLDHIWLGQGKGARARGNMLLPCTYQDLARAKLGEVEVGDIQLEKRGVVIGVEERSISRVIIDRQTTKLTGEALCIAVAQLIADNRLFKGVAQKRADLFHLWRLLHNWEPTLDTEHWRLDTIQATTVPEPQEELIQRLKELGVQTSEDLQLLEDEDLYPDLTDMSGVMQMELDDLLRDFPRIWVYQGSKYLCEPNPRAKKVVMQPADKATKKLKEPPAKHLPRFRGFRVIYKQASRSLTLR